MIRFGLNGKKILKCNICETALISDDIIEFDNIKKWYQNDINRFKTYLRCPVCYSITITIGNISPLSIATFHINKILFCDKSGINENQMIINKKLKEINDNLKLIKHIKIKR